MEGVWLHNMEVRRRSAEEKAMERRHTKQLRVVVVGHWHSGKSSVGNTILGRKEFDLRRTSKCASRQGEVAGRLVSVVEAPGWWNTYRLVDSLQLNKQELQCSLVRSVRLCAPGPHAQLLVIQADALFTETESRVLREHVELLGATVWNHILVLFTCGDWLGETPIEQHIEGEGDVLQRLVDTCRNRYHVLNNQDRAGHTQVTELLDKVEEMVARNDGYFLVEVPKPPPPKTKRKHAGFMVLCPPYLSVLGLALPETLENWTHCMSV
uniref:AIG1-type G domain-containing protein n=1 Tax=Electrophorus electricus TaxID=8005 RepID=A0A4W4EXC7_ELEEL